MKRFNIYGVTVEATRKDTIEYFDAIVSIDRLETLKYGEPEYVALKEKLYSFLTHKALYACCSDEYDYLELYWMFSDMVDRKWEESDEGKEDYKQFLAYQARMNEPDFDWSFYSDWHKDIYGFRPR